MATVAATGATDTDTSQWATTGAVAVTPVIAGKGGAPCWSGAPDPKRARQALPAGDRAGPGKMPGGTLGQLPLA